MSERGRLHSFEAVARPFPSVTTSEDHWEKGGITMFNNSYMNNQYTTPYMGYTQPYMAYQQQMQARQQMPMEQAQNQDVPFSEVRYGTLDEAKGYIVAPNRAIMFIDQDKSQFYIKRADSMGKPYLETYKYSSMDNLPSELKSQPQTSKNDGISTDLGNFLTKKDAEMFPTRKELDDIYKKLEQLQKKIQLNKVIEEGEK